MENSMYLPRIIDERVKEYLCSFGAVCLEGPKWCGKTWTALHHSRSAVFLGDPAGNFQNRTLAALDPSLVLEGEPPRLVDEWQEAPALWDAVRFRVDQRSERGLFLLTGSATPRRKGILHSGAGRIARLRMRPMSLWESGDSSGKVSLKALCEGRLSPVPTGEVNLRGLVSLIVRGGWPGSLGLSEREAALVPREYIRAIVENDVYAMDGVKRDAAKIRLLLRSLARNESTTVSNNTLKKDISVKDNEEISPDAVTTYLDIFQRLFLTENQPPFSSRLRSSVRVKQGEKRHFTDPSLACALLEATPEMLLHDLNTLGFLFEALCERDLRIYAESFDAKLYHYQGYDNKEIDAIIGMPDGSWCAFEIKLGANQIDEAAAHLKALERQIREDGSEKTPRMLCVLCGLAAAAYQREDGVYVVPLTALKP